MNTKNENHNIPKKIITIEKNNEKALKLNVKNDSINDKTRDQNKTDIVFNNNNTMIFDKGKNENCNQNQNCVINNITESTIKITKNPQNKGKKSSKNKTGYCNCCFGYSGNFFCYNACNKCYSKINIKNSRCCKSCKKILQQNRKENLSNFLL